MVDLSIVMLVYQRVSIEKKIVAVLHIYGHIYGVFFIYLDLLKGIIKNTTEYN